MRYFFLIFAFSLTISLPQHSYAQLGGLGKKLKKATEKALQKEVFGDTEEEDNNNSNNRSSSGSNNPSDVKGKKLEPPNINDLLANAKSSYSNERYSDARYDVKEAIKGVELEIGYKILELMPTSVLGNSYEEENDGVVSYGLGFAGLIIAREYEGNKQNIQATVGNNSALTASYGYMLNSSYASNDGNSKSVNIQGYRSNLSFDGDNTYTLAVPFAQSSVFILECEGFAGEDEVRGAADEFELKQFEELLSDSGTDLGTDNSNAVDTYLSNASSSYSDDDLEGTRFELQRGMVELDLLIGKTILAMLPKELGGQSADSEADDYMANTGGLAGVFVERVWGNEPDNQVSFSLMDDSPMMAMVAQFVNNPMMMGLSGKKSVKIDGYKAMVETAEDAEPAEQTINIPNNQSMITITVRGKSESEALQLANQIPVGDIFALIR